MHALFNYNNKQTCKKPMKALSLCVFRSVLNLFAKEINSNALLLLLHHLCTLFSKYQWKHLHFFFIFLWYKHSKYLSTTRNKMQINTIRAIKPLARGINHFRMHLIITCHMSMVSPIDDNTSRHWSLVLISHWRRRASCWRKRKCLNTGTLNMKQKNVPIIYYPQIAINIQSV